MFKSARLLFVLGHVILLVLLGCTTAGGGPQTWIDFPLNNSTVPLARLSITAHATHADGVTMIMFSVDGDEKAAVDVGGGRLEDATFEWIPPGPGRYSLEAYGLDASGNEGMRAVSVISVGGDAPAITISPTVTATISPTAGTITPTYTSTPTITATVPSVTPITPEPPLQPSVTANQNANCRAGNSTEFEVEAYLLIGEQAVIEGRLADNSWYVITPPGESSSCWIAVSVVDVSGDLSGVKIVTAPEPPEPPADNTPPTITANSVDPAEIVTQTCDDSGVGDRISISTIAATDESGIAEVSGNWILKDFHSGSTLASGVANYTSTDGQNFQASIGNVAFIGTINVTGTVVDNAGNVTSFSQTIEVVCP